MITTLMPHLRIGPYKEDILIAQIQMRSTQLDAASLLSSWLYIVEKKLGRERERERGETREREIGREIGRDR